MTTGALSAYFEARLKPALRTLLDRAIAVGEVRADLEIDDLLGAVAGLCMSAQGSDGLARARRMVAILCDGLRYAPSSAGARRRKTPRTG